MTPNGEFANDLLEPHKVWGQKTTVMFVIDLVVKPLLVLFIIANMFFFVFRVMPGDPASIYISGNLAATQPDLAQAIRVFWGFDLPLPLQYGIFMLHFFTGGFLRAHSFTEGLRPVGESIVARLPQTLRLTLIPFAIISTIFVVYAVLRRNNVASKSGWRRQVYEIIFSKWLWILLAIIVLWGNLQLGILGILPLYGSVSAPNPTDPTLYALDLLWHLVAPVSVICLLCTAVATHYFYQKPGEAMPPISHGVPRLLVWTASIALPLETWYNHYGLGLYAYTSLLLQNYPAVIAISYIYFLLFGVSALLVEAILRWTLYRNPVELHGHKASLFEKRSLRRIPSIIGLVLVFVFIGIAIAGTFVPPIGYWPRDAPLEYTLRGLFPLLVEGASVGIVATLVGGLLGLGAYHALRTDWSWPVKYIPVFIVSVIVLVFGFQVIVCSIGLDPISIAGTSFLNGAGLILSIGAIRRISNTDLGKGEVIWRNWARTLAPVFIFYCLIGGLLALVGGFMHFLWTDNLSYVIADFLSAGFYMTNPMLFLLPGAFIVLFVLAFDLLWCGLRN
ncbi:MAG: hypothetical protein ACFFCO_12735 [Promethearchaeota archaeon]